MLGNSPGTMATISLTSLTETLFLITIIINLSNTKINLMTLLFRNCDPFYCSKTAVQFSFQVETIVDSINHGKYFYCSCLHTTLKMVNICFVFILIYNVVCSVWTVLLQGGQ